MADTKKGKSTSLAYTDYSKFPGPFSLNTKSTKGKMTKSKSTPKPKKPKAGPGM